MMGDKKRTEIAVNKLCRKCVRNCRQGEAVLLLDCPRFLPRPFKSEELKFIQLDLFGNPLGED
jgi:hypothetical protein